MLRWSNLASGELVGQAVMYVDPDGEFIVPTIITILMLTTEIGYDIQKAISPFAIHIDLNFGSHANGIGIDVSIGVPQLAPLSYRYEAGATYYYGNRPGGYGPGWQVREGGEWGVGFGLFQYGGMRYRDYDKNGDLQADQVVHTTQIGMPIINVSYSNDTEDSFPWAKHVPFIPKLKEGQIDGYSSDRYRTASGRLRVALFELGFFLHTGEAEGVGRVDTDGDGIPDTRAFIGGNINDSKRSNGIVYFGFAGFKIGWDAEDIRHYLQNRVAHDHWSSKPHYGSKYPWVLRTKRKDRFVFQFGVF